MRTSLSSTAVLGLVLAGSSCNSGGNSLPMTSAPLDPTDAAGAGGTGGGGAAVGGSSSDSELGGSGGIGLTGTGNAPSTAAGGSDSAGGARDADSGADAAPEPSGTLRFYFVDSEGGQSTVIQLPNGQTLVIDSGNPGMRDGERMLAVLQGELGASRIDYLLTTHYDTDHVGGVQYLAARLTIGEFLDHGAANAPAQYLSLANAGTRRILAAGDVFDLGGVTVSVVAAAGSVLEEPLDNGGMPNPFCEGAQAALPGDNLDENVNSVGIVLRFGAFDFLDLADLLWPREHELACPNNLLGPIDLYLTTHHGLTRSGAPQLVRGIEPLAAVMNNGPRKGGGGSTWNTLALAPGAADVWQVHRALGAPGAQNAPLDQIANLEEGQADEARFLEVTVESSGQFTVSNPRTGFSKTYTSR